MSERYTVQQLRAALAVDANTARAWLDDLGIEPTPDRYDARRKWISSEDAQRVAEAHDRVLLAIPEDAPKTLASAMRTIARLQEENTQLRSQVRGLQSTLDGLGTQNTALHVPMHPKPRGGHPRASDTLPHGWESVEAFCLTHGFSTTTIKTAIDRGDLTAHHGLWKRGRSMIQHAVDAEQQEAIVAWKKTRQTS